MFGPGELSGANLAGALAPLLRRLCADYGVPETKLMTMLGQPAVSIDGFAASSLAQGPAAAENVSRLAKQFAFNSASAWIQRVDNSIGSEALFDASRRFLAISEGGRTLTGLDGKQETLPRAIFVGAVYDKLLPDGGRTLFGDAIRWMDLIEKRLLGCQIDLEMNFGSIYSAGTLQLWPVETVDRGVLVHSNLQKSDAPRRSSAAGVVVFNVKKF